MGAGRTAARAAQHAASLRGVELSYAVAAEVAAAVLGCAEGEERVEVAVDAARWDAAAGHREWVERDLRRRLALLVAEREALPVALPRLSVGAASAAGVRVVMLRVPVRRPPP